MRTITEPLIKVSCNCLKFFEFRHLKLKAELRSAQVERIENSTKMIWAVEIHHIGQPDMFLLLCGLYGSKTKKNIIFVS